ncbi:hypothetical protein CB1_001378001 [Camelus ferus]|nr:hypothetical protein CB1_001378001 [Camelus ferus]
MFFPATGLSFCSVDEISEGHVPEHNSTTAGTSQAPDMTAVSVGSVSHEAWKFLFVSGCYGSVFIIAKYCQIDSTRPLSGIELVVRSGGCTRALTVRLDRKGDDEDKVFPQPQKEMLVVTMRAKQNSLIVFKITAFAIQPRESKARRHHLVFIRTGSVHPSETGFEFAACTQRLQVNFRAVNLKPLLPELI